jgi:hypothetical protein
MQDPDLFFVVPTYRLRDVGETIRQYDEHFWRNGTLSTFWYWTIPARRIRRSTIHY